MARASVGKKVNFDFVKEHFLRRFFIHFYNIDDLMRCILPYHEHNYFTRAIQMLRFNDTHTSWSWLESAQV